MASELTATWPALGTTALVRIDDPAALPRARELLSAELAAIDLAASRFRPDSELIAVNAQAGARTPISPLLHAAIAAGLRAAALTGGAVDPTLGRTLRLAGYDRDWAALPQPAAAGAPAPPRPRVTVRRGGDWRQVRLADDPPTVTLPPGTELDLGATAKALCADRAARAVADATGAGTLVSLGGDIAVAGRVPAGGWPIHVTDDHRSGADAPGQTVTIAAGGLATSSTTTRRWQHAGETMHHIIDPRTDRPADGPWRTASVTARSCLDANIASTAALVLGTDAVAWLERQGVAARLVDHDGGVRRVGGWPPDSHIQLTKPCLS
jgi:thiamine biosynthesis lipoprotein